MSVCADEIDIFVIASFQQGFHMTDISAGQCIDLCESEATDSVLALCKVHIISD